MKLFADLNPGWLGWKRFYESDDGIPVDAWMTVCVVEQDLFTGLPRRE